MGPAADGGGGHRAERVLRAGCGLNRPVGSGLRRWAAALLPVALAAAWPWLARLDARGAQPPLRAVASTTILADLVRQVAGERWQVVALMPPGTDPHAFEPTPRDASVLASSRLVFLVGGGLELGSLVGLAHSTLPPGRVVELAPAVAVGRTARDEGTYGTEAPASCGHQKRPPHAQAVRQPHEEPDGERRDDDDLHGRGDGELDPHFWASVPHTIQAVRLIARALQEADPEGAAEYGQRAQRFVGELQALDGWVRQQVALLPPQRRLLVTNHETLKHFAAEYGFTVVGTVLPSASRLAAPSAAEAARLVQRLRELGVPAIFTETTVPATLARRLAAEAGVKVVELYSDSLGPAGSAADTYVGYMRTNVTRIVEALRESSRATSSPLPEAGGGQR